MAPLIGRRFLNLALNLRHLATQKLLSRQKLILLQGTNDKAKSELVAAAKAKPASLTERAAALAVRKKWQNRSKGVAF